MGRERRREGRGGLHKGGFVSWVGGEEGGDWMGTVCLENIVALHAVSVDGDSRSTHACSKTLTLSMHRLG